MKKLLFAMLIGAALAWLFDPDSGPKRREGLRTKLDDAGLTKSSSPSKSSTFGSTDSFASSTPDAMGSTPPSVASIP